MRHRVKSHNFSRDTLHRQALLRNLVRELIEHGQIVTTKAKAKEVKRWADRLISKAKTDSLATRRTLHTFFGKRDIVNTLVERVAPVFDKRNSGFTTMSVAGLRRGDNTQMVTLALVVKPEISGLKSQKTAAPAKTSATKTTAKATAKKAPAKATQKKAAAPTKSKETKTTKVAPVAAKEVRVAKPVAAATKKAKITTARTSSK